MIHHMKFVRKSLFLQVGEWSLFPVQRISLGSLFITVHTDLYVLQIRDSQFQDTKTCMENQW